MAPQSTLRVVVASVPDREGLVGEVWAGDEQVGEVSLRNGKPLLEICCRRNGQPRALDYKEFTAAIAEADERATGATSLER